MEKRTMLVLKYRILSAKVMVHLACIKQGIKFITKTDIETTINK